MSNPPPPDEPSSSSDGTPTPRDLPPLRPSRNYSYSRTIAEQLYLLRRANRGLRELIELTINGQILRRAYVDQLENDADRIDQLLTAVYGGLAPEYRDYLDDSLIASGDESLFAPILSEIFLESGDAFEAVQTIRALQQLGSEMGFSAAEIVDVQRGSIVARFRSWVEGFSSNPNVRKTAAAVVDEGRRHLENLTVERSQAENNVLNSTAIVNLMNSIATSENASIRSGSVLILKTNGNAQIRTLNAREMKVLDKWPEILANPKDFDSRLAELVVEEWDEPED